MIRILATTFAGLFGLAFGSFLNVCLSRWPSGESVVKPGSHCRNCNHTLAWWENFPLLSWTLLRGRCHDCKAPISWRYPIVEAGVAILWSTVAWRGYHAFFPPAYAIGMMLLMWLLVALAILDAEHLWLPNFLTIPGIALGIGWVSVQVAIVHSGLNFPPYDRDDLIGAFHWLLGIVAAAALILLIRWLYKLIRHREGIGLGDAKLMALLAAWLGLPGALLAFALGAVIGACTAISLLVLPRQSQPDAPTWAATKLPLGTFLCIGGIVSALWGQPLINAYLRWAAF